MSAVEATTVLVSFAVVFRLVTQRCVTNLKTIAKETTTVGAQKYIIGLCTLQFFFCVILPLFFAAGWFWSFSLTLGVLLSYDRIDGNKNKNAHFTTCAPPTRTKELSTTGSLRSMAVLVGRARAEKPRGDWGGSNLKRFLWFLFFSRLRRSCARLDKTAMLRRLTTGTSCYSAKFSVFPLYANVLPASQQLLTKNKTTLFSIINLVPHGPIYTVFIRLNAAAFIRGRHL